ncbi:hypothetical protein [Mesorhizobium sp.]|uniref:hypothetical protein n=1 Tax=Mesorhizobium sp. TaxID=1871066 RepID=UPI00258062A8|nr:hypothetical protein [Mesorhizobium sp.]
MLRKSATERLILLLRIVTASGNACRSARGIEHSKGRFTPATPGKILRGQHRHFPHAFGSAVGDSQICGQQPSAPPAYVSFAAVTVLTRICVLVWGTNIVGSAFAFVMTLMTAVYCVYPPDLEQSALASLCLANIYVSLVSLCLAAPLSANLIDLACLARFGLLGAS